ASANVGAGFAMVSIRAERNAPRPSQRGGRASGALALWFAPDLGNRREQVALNQPPWSQSTGRPGECQASRLLAPHPWGNASRIRPAQSILSHRPRRSHYGQQLLL